MRNANIMVGLNEYKRAENPQTIVTNGLTSCTGVAVYSPHIRVCYLGHWRYPEMFNEDIGLNAMLKEALVEFKEFDGIKAAVASGFQGPSGVPKMRNYARDLLQKFAIRGMTKYHDERELALVTLWVDTRSGIFITESDDILHKRFVQGKM